VPLIVCTVAANDSGFAPAATLPPATALLGARRDELFGRVIAGLDSAAASAVLADAEALLQEMPEDALLHYVAGCAAAAAGRRERALAGFRQARDLDPMPWRAPTAHNEAIRALAARSEGAILADVERAFAAAAGGQGVGWALMADHVHPTVQGQIVLARCVLAAAAAALPAWEWDLGRVRDDGYYRELLGDVPVERVGVEEAMAELLGSPPMAEFNAHNAARLRRQAQAGWAALTPAERRGARRWQSHRELAPLALEVADELFQAGDLCRARWHYSAAQREAPYTARGDLWAAMHWGWAVQLANGALTAAERDTLASALERTAFVALAPAMDGDYIAMVRGVLLHLLQRHDEALPELERAFASRTVRGQFVYSFFPALASELVAAGRVQDARTRAQQAAADGNPYFADLVETLAAGGRVGPPTASRSHPAQGTDPCRADTRR